jgi:hypothetical protein
MVSTMMQDHACGKDLCLIGPKVCAPQALHPGECSVCGVAVTFCSCRALANLRCLDCLLTS